MKKNYALLSGLVLASVFGIAQNANSTKFPEAIPNLEPAELEIKKSNPATKAYLDTLFYEDFNGSIPAGWTLQNNAGNSNNWAWSNTAPGGQYSTTTTALNSTSGANGYMSLPADLLNTPFPPGGPVAMDASFTSPAITITSSPSVLLRWDQSQRYCCSSANELVVEVSTDGITYTTLDAALGRSANTASVNGEKAELNVSGVLANQTTAYIRFRSTGNTHYYWMIDDVTLLEGPENSMVMDDWFATYTDTSLLTYNPVYTLYPQAILDPIKFGGTASNYGSNTQTGVKLNYEVIHDSTYRGGTGTGTGFQTIHNISYTAPVAPLGIVSDYVTTGFIAVTDGFFRARIFATSDSANQNGGAPTPPGLLEYSFGISDTAMRKTASPYVGDAGASNYVGGGNDGDRWGSLFTIGTRGAMATSLSLLVANVAANENSQIQPRIWTWSDTAASLANAIVEPPVGTSPFSTTIDTSMLGRWTTFPLFPPVMLNANTQYVAGWEQTGGASVSAEFTVARDRVREAYADVVTNFVYVNDASPGWGWVTQLGAIQINFGNLIIGLDDKEVEKVDFSVSPNPSNGELKINVSSTNATNYVVNVRNMLGQTVYTDNLSVNGTKTMNLDLTGSEKGVYFVTLENGTERLVKKVVLK